MTKIFGFEKEEIGTTVPIAENRVRRNEDNLRNIIGLHEGNDTIGALS
jgi:hypothetical protein